MAEDFVFRGAVADVDPELAALLTREDKRQDKTIILIASESASPEAVQEAMGSSFGNIYAEGYPREASRKQTQADIIDFEKELALYRRNSDPRYYKGVEYADVLEALTRRRAAELFAANGVKAKDMYVNVQALSGGPANSAVYTALLKPGDTIMGLKLSDGGHLSHGAPVNRTGQVYRSVSYIVDPETEELDYDAIEKLALKEKPNVIVAGFSAYPLIVDWGRFREIADKVGAYLHADIAHISGLVAAGVHPSPVGIADTVMTTTHKSLCGPRGAMIMSHRQEIGLMIDKAVFPGEQGGPHLNTMAALAVALKLAKTEQFRKLQKQIVANASRLAEQLAARGLRIVAGRSENHLLQIDCSSVEAEGVTLDGDMAARILDVAGIVANRNTIPGDRSAMYPSGVRIGTVWVSQLGYKEAEIDKLAEAMGTLLTGSTPHYVGGSLRKRVKQAKVSPEALRRARQLVEELTGKPALAPLAEGEDTLRLRGRYTSSFVDSVVSSDVWGLAENESQATSLVIDGEIVPATLMYSGEKLYYLRFADEKVAFKALVWLRDLSDGYVQFSDVHAQLSGPVTVEAVADVAVAAPEKAAPEKAASVMKPFFVGHKQLLCGEETLPAFNWEEPAEDGLKKTYLHGTHVEMGAKMVPFGGWDMPVWYSSVSEEHQAVRKTAGLFDVSHMGIFEASGRYAAPFLEAVTTNEVHKLAVGQSHYTYLLGADGNVIDDLMIYRVDNERYVMVVNASNNDKDWAWLTAVNEGRVCIDDERPWLKIGQPCALRNLRDRQHGDDCLAIIALQGPEARRILLSMEPDEVLAERIRRMGWARLATGELAGVPVIVSRTGYTGERVAYELLVHPDHLVDFWGTIMTVGADYGLKPAGLAARDSTRTEAGLPLYGHELAGPLNLSPDDACFGNFVKVWKPFFVGRKHYIENFKQKEMTLVRFRMDEKGVRRPEQGDPVLDWRGKVIGQVTSCAIDQDGYLLGLAFVPWGYRLRNKRLFIYQTGGGERPLRLPNTNKIGARMPVPDVATVLSRFP